MAFTVLITKDYDHMSMVASDILVPAMAEATKVQNRIFGLGLATGSTPAKNKNQGLYYNIVQRQNEFYSGNVISFNLDEYIGLPGSTPAERKQHPEAYRRFMQDRLLGKINPGLKETYIPRGYDIDMSKLEEAIESAYGSVDYIGTDSGKSVIICNDCPEPYLKWIRKEVMQNYISAIKAIGGIDWWVVGVGGRGHIGFHESGIPLDQEILLVKLDDNTVENAVLDGHFASAENSPRYAISMGAAGITRYSKNIMLLASGKRKTNPVAESLLGPITCDVPISILQEHAKQPGKNVIYVLDEPAAAGLFGREDILYDKGILVETIGQPIQYSFPMRLNVK
jgi:glucosamine-6-phosphate deaminase